MMQPLPLDLASDLPPISISRGRASMDPPNIVLTAHCGVKDLLRYKNFLQYYSIVDYSTAHRSHASI